MISPIRQFRSFLRRRGSILIMVVALLVLVALIATAMISTTTADRFGSQQHQQNVQIDLLVEGAKEIAKSVIVGDVYGDVGGVSVYRPGFSDTAIASGTVGFRNFDGLWLARPAGGDPAGVDTWLAPRTPTTIDPRIDFTNNAANFPQWAAITAPLATNYFSSPYKATAASPVRVAHSYSSGNIVFSPRTSIFQDPVGTMNATYLIPTATTTAVNGVRYPAFQLQLSGGGPQYNFLAADADGDGIADSFMQEVPIGDVNGVTYYYSFRIIDNNSAINVNTAFSSWRDYGNVAAQRGNWQGNLALFPSNIGLIEFFGREAFSPVWFVNSTRLESPALNSNANRGDIVRLLRYKLIGKEDLTLSTYPGVWMPDGVMTTQAGNTQEYPRDDAGAQRTDFRYFSLGDAMWMGLGRRMNLPATPGVAINAGVGSFLFTRLDYDIAMSLAYPFAIRDANAPQVLATNRTTSNVLIERLIPNSTVFWIDNGNTTAVRTGPYAPATDRGAWYSQNFDYHAEEIGLAALSVDNAQRPLRSILTSFNPTSNLASIPLNNANDAVTPVLGTFRQYPINRDSATWNSTNLDLPNSVAGSILPFDPNNPTAKTSINTASFAELYRSFWTVMQENWTTTGPSDTVDGGCPFTPEILAAKGGAWPVTYPNAEAAESPWNPYYGMKWEEVVPGGLSRFEVRGNAEAEELHPAKMFRSSIRTVPDRAPGPAESSPAWDNTIPRLTADQMVILRSAIAAANAKEMRDPDDSIEPVDVFLEINRDGTPIPVTTRIFGLERQPFITEIYAQTDDQELLMDTSGAAPVPVPGTQNPRGYVAIELYNPHDVPIDLRYCKLVAISRVRDGSRPANEPVLEIVKEIDLIAATSNLRTADPRGAVFIPARGYLVLENYDAQIGGPAADADRARHRPATLLPVNSLQPWAGLPQTGPAENPGTYTVPAGQLPVEVNYAYVPGLQEMLGREMVLMRPLDAAINQNTLALTYMTPDGQSIAPTWQEMAPLDSFDFTGLAVPGFGLAPPNANAWHYARATTDSAAVNSYGWHFVYPGRYNAGQSFKATDTGVGILNPRQQGTVRSFEGSGAGYGWVPPVLDPGRDGFKRPSDTAVARVTQDITIGQSGPAIGVINPYATYENTFPIQLCNTDQPGPLSAPAAPNTRIYPFGGFARAGDVMATPFIGSYWMTLTALIGDRSVVLEINPVTMDAAMAEDTDVRDDPRHNANPSPAGAEYLLTYDDGRQVREQIGRFCPLPNMNFVSPGNLIPTDNYYAPSCIYGDYPTPWLPVTDRTKLRYFWAKDLLDYFTVLNPQDDYLPNVLAANHAPTRYFDPANLPPPLPTPYPTPADVSPQDDEQPVQGLININTASAKVLSAVPWFPMPAGAKANDLTFTAPPGGSLDFVVTPGADQGEDNAQLARAIVLWRDGDPSNGVPGNGPLHSLYDLYRIPAFRDAQRIILQAIDPGVDYGDLSPFDLTGARRDLVRFDYEEQYLLLTRVSNLLTTRSDAFTVYILVQGWRNVGTQNPELVVQRRAAMMVDRSRCNNTDREPVVIPIPTP